MNTRSVFLVLCLLLSGLAPLQTFGSFEDSLDLADDEQDLAVWYEEQKSKAIDWKKEESLRDRFADLSRVIRLWAVKRSDLRTVDRIREDFGIQVALHPEIKKPTSSFHLRRVGLFREYLSSLPYEAVTDFDRTRAEFFLAEKTRVESLGSMETLGEFMEYLDNLTWRARSARSSRPLMRKTVQLLLEHKDQIPDRYKDLPAHFREIAQPAISLILHSYTSRRDRIATFWKRLTVLNLEKLSPGFFGKVGEKLSLESAQTLEFYLNDKHNARFSDRTSNADLMVSQRNNLNEILSAFLEDAMKREKNDETTLGALIFRHFPEVEKYLAQDAELASAPARW